VDEADQGLGKPKNPVQVLMIALCMTLTPLQGP
jgi:hypothetical protein